MGETSVFETISREYYSLTASEKKTADYLMAHQEESQFMSIAELAEECGVAEATVSRFCRRLGYKGYNAFKLAIANATAHLQRDPAHTAAEGEGGDSLEEISQKLFLQDSSAIGQTLALLDYDTIREAADILRNAERVFCMGQGGSMLIANEAAHVFTAVSEKFFAVSDSHMQIMRAANMGSEDVIMFFSYSGATRELTETMQVAKKRGAKILLVTRFSKSPGGKLADLVLQCGANEGPLQLGSIAAKMAQLFLLDVLFAEFCLRDPQGSEESRERIATALADKHL